MLKQELGEDSELIPGHSGIFKVEYQGRVVAEKSRGTFPTEDEIVDAVERARMAPSHPSE